VRVFWQGPSFGFDFGADGARTMMLVYSLPQTGAIFNRFGGINGSAYLVGGFSMTALTGNNIVVVPIRSGIGLRLGANLGRRTFLKIEIEVFRSLSPGPFMRSGLFLLLKSSGSLVMFAAIRG
jgi:hypothetical protein